ncbi:type II/IV secretion system protein [Candidatus Azambacteria bacterium]|nr:type II/IV secretion system protein [Candidatus Azambacteria bacterium]
MVFKGEQKEEEFLAKVRREEEENRAKILAEKTGLPYLNLAFIPIESDALKLIPKETAEKSKIAAINREAKILHLAAVNPDDKETQSAIGELEKSGYAVKIFVVSESGLKKALSFYPPAAETKEITGQVEISNTTLSELKKEIADIKTLQKVLENLFEAKASQIVEAALAGALILKASDIHFEPEEGKTRIRLRLDGLLEDITFIPEPAYFLLLNRIKLLSGLKLNIHEKAQDGRFSISSDNNEIEIRTSVLPGAYGENIVMRVLNPSAIKIGLENLGIREDDLEIINQELKKPTGMILTTGPTGSGKTTTLYAFIKKILAPDIKIITIEDPIEYHIEGVSQTQVEPDKGYTFENGLRSIVRQDPDVILVGEIRDYETAEIAMHAALTGHLVFSTLHTNDSIGAIPRLIDLGVKPPVIAPAINLLMAQRLLRRVCPKCAKKRPITAEELENFKKILKDLPPRVKLEKELNEKIQILEPRGCKECHNGYSGRVAVMELLKIDDEMEDLILKSPTEIQIKTAAVKSGFVSMAQDATIKIITGITTIEESERVLGSFL